MKWLLLVLLAVLLIAGVLATIRRRPARDQARPQVRCLKCRGTGWINQQPERTLNFVGDGFEDRHTPAMVCPACGGTGVAPNR